jgi:hypothetical protein
MTRTVFLAAIFVALSACSDATHTLKPSEVNAVRLTEVQPKGNAETVAVEKTILALKSAGENPEDFFLAPIENTADGTIELPLYYKAAFQEPEAVGNPGGKSRTVVYDPVKQVVVKQLWWQ